MSIDERLEALTQSVELLTANVHAMQESQVEALRQQQEAERRAVARDARERRLREALLRGIAAFLSGLREEGGEV